MHWSEGRECNIVRAFTYNNHSQQLIIFMLLTGIQTPSGWYVDNTLYATGDISNNITHGARMHFINHSLLFLNLAVAGDFTGQVFRPQQITGEYLNILII